MGRHFFCTGGPKRVNIYSTQTGHVANKTRWSGALVLVIVPSRGLPRKITLTFPRYIVLGAQREQELPKVKIDLCQSLSRNL